MSNQVTTLKLNRFISYLQQPTTNQTQSPSPSPPSDFIALILFHLKQLLDFIPGLFTAFFDKLNNIFPPETRHQWLQAAAHLLPFIIAGALLLCFLFCCLPVILTSIVWVFAVIFNLIKGCFMLLFYLIKGFFMLLINGFKSMFRCLCCCGQRSVNMMKAPGTGGKLYIPRPGFESNPAAYFRGLRASSSPLY
ncbi:hypothetical protein RND81_07G175000 [Saponaria officinalis]|uniref:Uncharacterized protein n=1 Tax=Saponaria officinalis TaxID=3572 RepID=A0AAW1JPN7_SAPOF